MSSVPPVVAVLGPDGPRIVAPDEPVVTVDDLGLTRGDGCFDSALVVDPSRSLRCDDAASKGAPHHRVRDLEEHLDRLDRSAAALDLEGPPRAAWVALVDAAVDAWSTPGDASIKLVLTRGREWGPEAGPTAFAVVTARPAGRPQRGDGGSDPLRVVTLTKGHPSDAFADAPWLLGGVKTLSYVVNVAAQREGRRRGADDVIFTTTDGFALDGPMAGLLVVREGRWLSTPTGGTGILASVSVATILDAAAADGHESAFELVRVEHLHDADGVWLVASSRGPTPVGEIDGRPVRVDPDLVSQAARYAGF